MNHYCCFLLSLVCLKMRDFLRGTISLPLSRPLHSVKPSVNIFSGKSLCDRMTHRRRGYYPGGGSAGGTSYAYPTVGYLASSPTAATGRRRRLPSLSSLSASASAKAEQRSQSSSYLVTTRLTTGQNGRSGRRLPATPNHPTTLNIDSLGNVSSPSGSGTGGIGAPRPIGEHVNFPKLDPSPSRQAAIRNVSTSGARQGGESRRRRRRDELLSRGSVVERDGLVSGRGGGGGRQLPRVGPECDGSGILMIQGASSGGIRRELPRPGTTIGLRYSKVTCFAWGAEEFE